MFRSFASPFFIATTVVATPTLILDTNDTIAGLGKVEGFTFPRLGGEAADRTVFGTYVDEGNGLALYHSDGSGFLDGLSNKSVDAAGNTLNGFGDFGISSNNHPMGVPVVAFVSTAADVDGVFLQLPTGVILQLASTAQVYEPANGTFYYLSEVSVAVSEDKRECYVAFAARAGSSWRGVLLATVPTDADSNDDVVLTTVVDTATPIPKGNVSVNFRCMSVPQTTPQGDVVFFGSNCGSSGSPMVEAQFNKLAFSGKNTRDSDILTKNRGSFRGATNVNPGIWRWGTDGSLAEVVNFETTIPGGQPGEAFVAFSDPGVSLDGTAAFVGLGNNGSYGVFKESRAKPLSLVAGRQTPMPGYENHTFQNIPNIPSVGPQGEVVFYGAATSEIAGIYAEDPITGALSSVITLDAQVEGQGLLYIGFGTQAYGNGLAAAYMVLEDTTCGIWNVPVTQTPPTELI